MILKIKNRDSPENFYEFKESLFWKRITFSFIRSARLEKHDIKALFELITAIMKHKCRECDAIDRLYEDKYCFDCYIARRESKAKGNMALGSVSSSLCDCGKSVSRGGLCEDCFSNLTDSEIIYDEDLDLKCL